MLMQSLRLPAETGAGAAAELILKALKLAFAHQQRSAQKARGIGARQEQAQGRQASCLSIDKRM